MGSLKIISDSRIRSIISKGPKYRFSAKKKIFKIVLKKLLHLLMNIVVVGVKEKMWSVML